MANTVAHGELLKGIRVIIDAMRYDAELQGARFRPSFNECIRIVQKEHAIETGELHSFEMTAYSVLYGFLEKFKGKEYADRYDIWADS